MAMLTLLLAVPMRAVLGLAMPLEPSVRSPMLSLLRRGVGSTMTSRQTRSSLGAASWPLSHEDFQHFGAIDITIIVVVVAVAVISSSRRRHERHVIVVVFHVAVIVIIIAIVLL